MVKISSVIEKGRIYLAHIPEGDRDVIILLAYILGLDNPKQLLIMKNEKIEERYVKAFQDLLERRGKLEPVALIIGEKEFWSRNFTVNYSTLIPRPETELIIELVKKHFVNNDAQLNILDLGTGSGCLIITLLAEYHNSKGIAVDISEDALEVAKQNALRHEVGDRIKLMKSNWLEELTPNKFDVVVANPPYISSKEMKELMPDVLKFEPKEALTDFDDGVRHYQSILKSLKPYLHKGSRCFFEMGYNQMDAISKMVKAYGYKVIAQEKDWSKKDRCIVFSE